MILHTEIKGQGEPIVFLHSGLQTGSIDFDAQQAYFQKNYQVITPDLRGHGKSMENDFSNFFTDCATDLAETLTANQLEKVHVVGSSLGALVAVTFSEMFPKRIHTLTLSGILLEKPANWTEMNRAQFTHQMELLKNDQTVQYFDQLHASDWKQFIFMGKEESWYPFETTKKLHTSAFPVLLIVGERNKDELTGLIEWKEKNENGHISVVPFAGHLVQIDQANIYSPLLEMFLKKFPFV